MMKIAKLCDLSMMRMIFGPDYDRRCTCCGQWLRNVRAAQRVVAQHEDAGGRSGQCYTADHCGSRYCEAYTAAYAWVKLSVEVVDRQKRALHEVAFVHRVLI